MTVAGLALGFGLIVLSGCGEFGGASDGPCYVEQEPVLWIVAATDADGQSLSTIEISEVTFNGESMPNASGSYSSNITVIEEELEENSEEQSQEVEDTDRFYECQLPCAFGSDNGTYGFVATAPGQDPKTVEVDAEYGTRSGSGCPLYLQDGTEIEISF